MDSAHTPNRRRPRRVPRSLRGDGPDITPVSEHLVKVGRHHIRVRRSGSGSPLLLLNGMGMSTAAWQPLERHLSGFERIKVGLPGAGGALARQPLLTMRHFAALAAGVIDELDLEQTDVLGLSFGGMVAQQLAHDRGTRVRGLVLVSTSCGLGGEPSTPASWWNALLTDSVPSGYPWNPYEFAHRWSQVMMREFGAGWATGPRLKGFVEQTVAATPWSSLPWLPELTQQTLIVAGTADALVPVSNAATLAARLPHAQTHLVPGGGHLCALDRAAEVGPVIANFLRSLQARGSSDAAAVNEVGQLR